MHQIVLLGPQRENPTVAAALRHSGAARRIAVISAGWQEREGELDALAGHLGDIELMDLRLYERTEDVFHSDADLFDAWRRRQDGLRELQRLYRVRLRHAMAAEHELTQRAGIDDLIARERAHALTAVRELDRHHLREIRRVHFQYWRRWQPAQRPTVAGHRAEIERILVNADALLVAGGHVGVLLSRMRLYDIGPLLGRMTLIGWSAGAMALSQRVVLFHDFAPQGPGYAEVLDAGLGAYRSVVALPDASARLALDDSAHVALLARRLQPAVGVGLDEASVLAWDGRDWKAHGRTIMLQPSGQIEVLAQ